MYKKHGDNEALKKDER